MEKKSCTNYKMADSLHFVVSEMLEINAVSEYYGNDGTIVSSVIARTRLFTKTSQKSKSNVSFRLLLFSLLSYHN